MGRGTYYRYNAKDTTAGVRTVTVSRLRRWGLLRPGAWSSVTWSRDGRETARIGVRAEAGAIVLDYRWRQGGGEWQDVSERVPLDWTACHYGGQRPWFLCPGVVNGHYCGRRVGVLYLVGRYFLCRHCHGLTYESTRERPWDRGLRKAQAIRERLGGTADLHAAYPEKPKGMHWATYERLIAAAEEAEAAYTAGLLVHLGAVDKRLSKLLEGLS